MTVDQLKLRGILDVIPNISEDSCLKEKIEFLKNLSNSSSFPDCHSPEEEYILRCLELIQPKDFLRFIQESPSRKKIIQKLQDVDFFYKEKGGIIGYQHMILELLKTEKSFEETLAVPQIILVEEDSKEQHEAIQVALENLPKCCEIYVVGGAADRLGFFHSETHESLPAAAYIFLGKPLLGWLIDDLKAKELLFYKKYGKKIITPICLMTADEEKNDQKIRELLIEYNYFERPKESFIFIRQPMVPVVDPCGNWIYDNDILLKPSGHGALWLSGLKQDVFKNLQQQGYEYATIRQINNPLIGVDTNLMLFLGLGIKNQQSFGFFVTDKKSGRPEGVICVKKIDNGKVISNVEYCNLASKQLNKEYPANTNLLFIKLSSLEKAIKSNPYPGSLLNFKEEKNCLATARLELTMQNISEAFVDANFNEDLPHKEVFILKQKRNKAISPIKKLKTDDVELQETPIKASFDMMKETYSLLKDRCCFTLPSYPEKISDFMQKLPFLFVYNHVIGPFYDLISNKLKKWTIHSGAKVYLDIAELYAEDIDINGDLYIKAESYENSVCHLKNVKIVNAGFVNSLDEIKSNYKLSIFIGKNASLKIQDSILSEELIEVPAETMLVIDKNQRFFVSN